MTSTKLKIIACITMLIDHMSIFINYNTQRTLYILLRSIGRLSFPIFAFLIAEGFYHTRHAKKYMLRLLIFAFISEIPYDLAFNNQVFFWGNNNIFFTLVLGLLSLMIYKWNNLVGFCAAIGLGYIANITYMDYGIYGVMLIFLFYVLRFSFFAQMGGLTLIMVINVVQRYMRYPGHSISLQAFAVFSAIILSFYNGEKGRDIRYFFYIFYPGHLIILAFIKYVLLKQ